jgi:DNA (cytosine-5)-methyltransferase 1
MTTARKHIEMLPKKADLIIERPYVEEENRRSKKRVKIVDLFAGIGGFHYGISASASRLKMGVEPLLVSEIEPSCQVTYAANHRCEVQGDINALDLSYVDQVADIVTAGFPCQPFSNSGRKLGLSDPRGQFYFRIEEIIKKFHAKAFILENVPGMKTNGGGSYPSQLAVEPQLIGQTMKYLEQNLLKLKDYQVQWIEIDSSKLGSPQVRKRVYIIGVHKDFSSNFCLDFGKYQHNNFMSVVDEMRIEELQLSKRQESNLRSFINHATPPSYKDGMRRVGKAYLCDGGNVGQGYHAHGMVPTLTKVWARFMPIYFPDTRESIPELGTKDFKPNQFYGKGYIRKASVREVMRLQGFPDSFVPFENPRRAYEHAGNAVNAKIIREIADNLLRVIV